MCHTALMLLPFIAFRVLKSIAGSGRSKVSAFDRRWAFCGPPNFAFNRDRRPTSRDLKKLTLSSVIELFELYLIVRVGELRSFSSTARIQLPNHESP
jgi:hypothetical protein